MSPEPTHTLSAEPKHQRGAHWKDDTGRAFTNPWPSARAHGPADVAKFMWAGLWTKQPDLASPATIAAFVPTTEVDLTPPQTGVKATWLGHAAVFLQFAVEGKKTINVLCDPVFSERCGPKGILGPKRFTPPPISGVDALPEIDIVAISHNHYDHLDLLTLAPIFARPNPPALIMPLNTRRVVGDMAPAHTRELDWWETVDVGVRGKGTLRFTASPAQHMTARTAFDQAASLWAGYCMQLVGDGGVYGKKVWFAGDTGYASVTTETYDIDDSVPVCPAFKELGEREGPFDLALIPIGAYAPRNFLSTVHCAPIDAVRVFRDVRAKKALAIHWGTWNLSHEPVSEPPRMLADARKALGISEDEFGTCPLGGSVSVA